MHGKAPLATEERRCPGCGRMHYPTVANMRRHTYACSPCRQKSDRKAVYEDGDHRHGRHWTREEVEAAVRNELVEGRSTTAVIIKKHKLGIQNRAFWNADTIAFLRKFYPLKGGGYCAEKLGRTPLAIRKQASELGIKGRPRGRPAGILNKKRRPLSERQRSVLYSTVGALVPQHIPTQIREEIISSMVLDALDSKIAFDDLPSKVKEYRTKVYAMFPEYGAPDSLDAKLFEDGKGTLGDTISSDAFRF